MPRPEKPALLKWLYRLDGAGGVFSLRNLLYRGAQTVLRKNAIDAEGYTEANLTAFWNYVVAAQDEDERRGISRILTVVDQAALSLEWYTLKTNQDTAHHRKLSRLRHRPAFLNMIDAITNREYEALACVAMQLVGASEIRLTPAGTEGGVDFFALLRPPAHCHLFAGTTNPIRIIGQSKKYAREVGAKELKEFLWTMNEVKHRGEPKTNRIVPDWFHSVRGPIIGCMIGHCGFQSGAASRARNHGIIVADSLDLAEMLTLSRGIPEYLPGAVRATECVSRLRLLLQ
jgi:Restriction endonuclease